MGKLLAGRTVSKKDSFYHILKLLTRISLFDTVFSQSSSMLLIDEPWNTIEGFQGSVKNFIKKRVLSGITLSWFKRTDSTDKFELTEVLRDLVFMPVKYWSQKENLEEFAPLEFTWAYLITTTFWKADARSNKGESNWIHTFDLQYFTDSV